MAAGVQTPARRINQNNFQLGVYSNFANEYAAAGHAAAQDQQRATDQMQGVAQTRAFDTYNRATPQTNFYEARRADQGAFNANARAGQNVAQQNQTFGDLRSFAMGQGGAPSGAEAMLRAGANQSFRQNLAAGRAGTGFGESASGLAGAQRANVDAMANAGNAAAQLRSNEFQQQQANRLAGFQAAGQIANQAGGMELARGQMDLQRSQNAANQAQFLTQTELAAQQQRDQATQGYEAGRLAAFGAGAGVDAAAYDRELAAQQARMSGTMGYEDAVLQATDIENRRKQAEEQLAYDKQKDAIASVTGAVQGAATMGMASDRRVKKNIRSVSLAEVYADLS